MFLIEDELSGVREKFDGPLDHAIKKMQTDLRQYDATQSLWWVYANHNVKLCEVSKLSPNPKLDWGEIVKLGWSIQDEFKCPLCGSMFGKNLKGESPVRLVAAHVSKHFNTSLQPGD